MLADSRPARKKTRRTVDSAGDPPGTDHPATIQRPRANNGRSTRLQCTPFCPPAADRRERKSKTATERRLTHIQPSPRTNERRQPMAACVYPSSLVPPRKKPKWILPPSTAAGGSDSELPPFFFCSTWFVFTSFPVSARRSVPSYIPRASYYDTLKLPSFFYNFFFLLYRPRCRPKEQLDQVRRPRRAKNVQRPVCLRGACRCRAALMFPHARSQILGQPLCRSVIFEGELQFMRVSADKLPHRSICQRSP